MSQHWSQYGSTLRSLLRGNESEYCQCTCSAVFYALLYEHLGSFLVEHLNSFSNHAIAHHIRNCMLKMLTAKHKKTPDYKCIVNSDSLPRERRLVLTHIMTGVVIWVSHITSNYYIFRHLKKFMAGKYFEDDDNLKDIMKKQITSQAGKFIAEVQTETSAILYDKCPIMAAIM